MTTWTEFLAQSAPRKSASLGTNWQAELAHGYVCSPQLNGLLQVEGEDAAQFLHNQLTNDVLRLNPQHARLAGYCNNKGRMLASFLTWQYEGKYFLQLPHNLLPSLQKKLQMYVLRAKAKLSDASASTVCINLGGEMASQFLAQWFAPFSEVLSKQDHADPAMGFVIRLPDSLGQAHYQWRMPEAGARALWPQLSAALPYVEEEIAELIAVHSGVASIRAETVEKFVPQMINFELVGGINFKKGCYPGQEIVARSQYLGKLKRRLYLAHSAQALEIGDDIFSDADPEQACGMVVNLAHNPAGGTDCLVELKVALAESRLTPRTVNTEAALQLLPLPYTIPSDAA